MSATDVPEATAEEWAFICDRHPRIARRLVDRSIGGFTIPGGRTVRAPAGFAAAGAAKVIHIDIDLPTGRGRIRDSAKELS